MDPTKTQRENKYLSTLPNNLTYCTCTSVRLYPPPHISIIHRVKQTPKHKNHTQQHGEHEKDRMQRICSI